MYLPIVAILLLSCGQVFLQNLDYVTKSRTFNAYAEALSILQAVDRKAELIRILPDRTMAERQKIAEAYKTLNSGTPLIPKGHTALSGDPFNDLLYAMMYPYKYVAVNYLHAALHSPQPELYINITMDILVIFDANKANLIRTYNSNSNFKESLLQSVSAKITNDNYRDFLQQLIQRHREPEPMTWFLDPNTVNGTTYALVEERENWNNNRTILDYVLMGKSCLFGQYVIIQFIQLTGGEDIVDAIDKYISDENLKIGYKNLVEYVMDKWIRVIDRIHDSVDEPMNQYATNILYINMFSENFLYSLDLIFIEKYGKFIRDYLASKNAKDPVFQMLMAIAIP